MRKSNIAYFNNHDDAYDHKHSIKDWYNYDIRRKAADVWIVHPMGWEGVEKPNRMFRQGGK